MRLLDICNTTFQTLDTHFLPWLDRLSTRSLLEQVNRKQSTMASSSSPLGGGMPTYEELRAEMEKMRIKNEKLTTSNAELTNSNAELTNTTEKLTISNRKTTLNELLEHSHQIQRCVTVEPNINLCTQGTITSPTGKFIPHELKKWDQFPQARSEAFSEMCNCFAGLDEQSSRLFPARLYLEEVATKISEKPLTSEQDLTICQSEGVDSIVKNVINAIAERNLFPKDLAHIRKLDFDNHNNILTVSNPSSDPSKEDKKHGLPVKPDKLCTIKLMDEKRQLIFILEEKAAHKLTSQNLREGLHPMDIGADVVQRVTTSSATEAKSEWLAAAATSQTFTYMVKKGLEYGCYTIGHSIVFLQIKEHDPNNLYYHLAEPVQEVQHGGSANQPDYALTAVAQILSFCFMAFRSQIRPQSWTDARFKELDTWDLEDETLLQQMSPGRTPVAADTPSPWVPLQKKWKGDKESPTHKSDRKLRSAASCAADATVSGPSQKRPPDDSSRQDHQPSMQHLNSAPKTPTRNNRSGNSSKDPQGQPKQQMRPHSAYCTQACLSGLQLEEPLDESCPNYAAHKHHNDSRFHTITQRQFSFLVYLQLAISLDDYVLNLSMHGNYGVLFKITLASHGYTFVAKATSKTWTSRIVYEASVYERLFNLQGISIPIWLGNIDLANPWYDVPDDLTHMMLLAYGGTNIWVDSQHDERITPEEIWRQIRHFHRDAARYGVLHRDVMGGNVLWSDERQRLIFIDFESCLMRPIKPKQPDNEQIEQVADKSIARQVDETVVDDSKTLDGGLTPEHHGENNMAMTPAESSLHQAGSKGKAFKVLADQSSESDANGATNQKDSTDSEEPAGHVKRTVLGDFAGNAANTPSQVRGPSSRVDKKTQEPSFATIDHWQGSDGGLAATKALVAPGLHPDDLENAQVEADDEASST